jgi:hypothetical protein
LVIGEALEDPVRTVEFDPDQLERLMVAAFELMGKPEAQAQELARSILRAAERPQSGDPRPPSASRMGEQKEDRMQSDDQPRPLIISAVEEYMQLLMQALPPKIALGARRL